MLAAQAPVIAAVRENQQPIWRGSRRPHREAAIARAVAGAWRKYLTAAYLAAERTSYITQIHGFTHPSFLATSFQPLATCRLKRAGQRAIHRSIPLDVQLGRSRRFHLPAWPDGLGRTRFDFGRVHRGEHVVIGRAGDLGLLPLGKGIEEARDVFDDLASILAGEVTPEAPLP